MQLTPHRAELMLEALQLREFGWTQQEIADALSTPSMKVPQQTISYWFKHFGNGTISDVGKYVRLTNIDKCTPTNIKPPPITLYPCKYEEAGEQIPTESVDLIVTDPPYLVSSTDITRNGRSSLQRDFGAWDNSPQADYERDVECWANLMSRHLKVGGTLYLFMSLTQYTLWTQSLDNSGLTSAGELIWHRINPAPQIRKTRYCHAFNAILFYTKGTPKTFNWLGQNEMHNVITGPICGGNEREYHPTQKPRWLLEKLIAISSLAGETVLDSFAGSGSTGFAAFRLHRKSILVEPMPKYRGLIEGTAQEEFNTQVILKGGVPN
jgi:site-specific DNA-methyltransferase (adenine-specific)